MPPIFVLPALAMAWTKARATGSSMLKLWGNYSNLHIKDSIMKKNDPWNNLEILTDRFLLRPLTEDDISPRYLNWFADSMVKEMISFARKSRELEELRTYVLERQRRPDVLFLGIFHRASKEHIGNLKYEPINQQEKYAIMGILIGEPQWRSKGVASEVLATGNSWMCQHLGIQDILLGVQRKNLAAIRAYEKIGFKETTSPFIHMTPGTTMTMVWRPSGIAA
jgi:RimJ/RimL family protein N-acetyltransferase